MPFDVHSESSVELRWVGLGLSLLASLLIAVVVEPVLDVGSALIPGLGAMAIATVAFAQVARNHLSARILTLGAAIAGLAALGASGNLGLAGAASLVVLAVGAALLVEADRPTMACLPLLAAAASLLGQGGYVLAALVAALALPALVGPMVQQPAARVAGLDEGRQPVGPAEPQPRSQPAVAAPAAAMAGRAREQVVGAVASGFVTIGVEPKLSRAGDADMPTASFPHAPAHQFEGFRHRRATVRAASHIGTRHLNSGGPRQDSYAVGQTRTGSHIVVAVADGVGSAKHSSTGSEWAARIAVGRAVHMLDRGQDLDAAVVADTTSEWVERMSKIFFGQRTTMHDVATTLVVASICVETFNCQLFRVGDSEGFQRVADGWHPLFPASGLEDATAALPSNEPAIEHASVDLAPNQCLLLVTDGIADPLIHSTDVGAAFHVELATPPSQHEFSALVGFQRQQAHDDQTAVAVWRTD